MHIALFGAAQGSNVLVELDMGGVTTDEGAAMTTPFLVSTEWSAPGGEGKLRRITQAVHVSGNNTVRLTPVADAQVVTAQAEDFALLAVDGPTQFCESGPSVEGSRFGVELRVTAYAGGLEFGEGDLALLPKRASPRA